MTGNLLKRVPIYTIDVVVEEDYFIQWDWVKFNSLRFGVMDLEKLDDGKVKLRLVPLKEHTLQLTSRYDNT